MFNAERYPGVWAWFQRLEAWLAGLKDLEVCVDGATPGWKETLRETELLAEDDLLVPVAVEQHPSLDVQRGLVQGALVSVAPEDTGRDHPTIGTLVKIGVEEVVIKPIVEGEIDVRIHFPRLGFVVKVAEGSRL